MIRGIFNSLFFTHFHTVSERECDRKKNDLYPCKQWRTWRQISLTYIHSILAITANELRIVRSFQSKISFKIGNECGFAVSQINTTYLYLCSCWLSQAKCWKLIIMRAHKMFNTKIDIGMLSKWQTINNWKSGHLLAKKWPIYTGIVDI